MEERMAHRGAHIAHGGAHGPSRSSSPMEERIAHGGAHGPWRRERMAHGGGSAFPLIPRVARHRLEHVEEEVDDVSVCQPAAQPRQRRDSSGIVQGVALTGLG